MSNKHSKAILFIQNQTGVNKVTHVDCFHNIRGTLIIIYFEEYLYFTLRVVSGGKYRSC